MRLLNCSAEVSSRGSLARGQFVIIPLRHVSSPLESSTNQEVSLSLSLFRRFPGIKVPGIRQSRPTVVTDKLPNSHGSAPVLPFQWIGEGMQRGFGGVSLLREG